MDKKKQRTPSAPRLEREEKKERTEDRKKIRKTKGAEADASSKITDSELQQQQRKQDELTNSDQSEGNVRMKIGFGAKRTKKPPKSLENFICRPTVRVSQRLSHGDGHGSGGGEGSGPGITGANQSHREIQNKDNNDCVSSKASTSLNPSTPFQTSSKKNDPAVVTPVNTSSKKAPSKQTRKSDTKSLLTSDGPSYAVQPQTDSKVPLSDRITSSTPLKQTYSPPAAPSPPSSLQLNSSPQDSTQVLNIQREKGEDFPTGATMTALISHSLKDMTQKAQTSQQQSPSSSKNDSEHTSFPVSCSEDSLPIKQTPCPQKKNPKIRESNAEKVLNPNEKEDVKKNGNSTGSKNMCNTVTNKRSKENGLVHQPSSSIKTPSLLPALDKSADSSIPENSTSVPELLENKGKNKNHNAKEDLDETRKMTMEPAQITSAAQPKVRNIIDKSKRKSKHSSNQEEDVQCTSDTTSRPDSQLNTPILSTDKSSSDEPPLAKQNINSQKKQKEGVHMTKMTTQVEKMDLAKNANVNSTACKTVPQTSKLKKIPSIKSLKALSSPQFKPRPVGRPPKLKQLQNPSPRSETLAIEHQPKKRGRPKMIRFETPQGKMSHKSSAKPPVPEPSNAPNPEVDLTLPKSTQRKRGRPKRSSSVHPQSSEPPDSSSVNQGAGDNLKPSKAKDTQISSKRNRLIMKTIIKNINKMRVKKRDEVLTQFILGQRQSNKSDFPQKDNEEDADCSVSDATHSLSSLVTSFGGKLGPQINVSKRGTIYMGKRRGRKPKSQRENSDHAAEQTPVLKPQQMAESSNQLNSWSTSGQHKHSFDSQSASLCSSQYTFKHPESLSSTVGCFRKKLYPGNYGYDQHPAPNVTSSQKAKAMPEDKSKPHSSLQSPLPSTTTQLGPVRMQDCRTAHLAQSVLMEQERLKFKGHRKGHICLSRDKIRRHKHKCKRKYLQLRAKRQDPAFLAEVEDLVVRLSEIHIVHQIAQGGCGDDTKNGGRKSVKGKNHPHVLQCLPQNLHHPTMFQINFSGYYSPQSDFSRDSLHYVGMADFKRNNGCPSEPTEHIVTHCPVVHKLGFPLSGGGCYHPPYKMPLSATSFGFGLYRGYPPSATIYPSSPFLPSYVQPYPKNPILSPSKFHKRKHKYLRRDSVLCGGKPQGTYPRVASHPPSDWFSRNSWQREDNREPGRDKRVVDDRLRGNEREGTECLLGQSKLRKDHVNRSSLSSNAPCSSSTLTDKRKTSPLSFIGPAHLRPVSKVRWAEHPQIWRWRGSAPPKQSNSSLNQEAEPGYQEEDTLEGPESDEDLPSPPLSDRTIRHHTFLKNPNLAKSAYSRRTVQRGIGEVLCASRDLMRPGSTLMKEPCTSGEKRASESFHSGGVLFREHAQHDSPSPTEGQERGRETRPNISRSLFHTNNISPFSSCTARKNSLLHSGNSKTTTLTKGKLKHANNPFKSKIPQSREVTGSEVKKRRPGRPRKNPAPCFSPSLPASPLHHEVTECPAKRKKSERDDHTVLNAIATLAQEEKKRGRKRKDGEKRRDGGQIDKIKDTAEIQDPSHSHTSPSSPSQDASVAVHSQSDRSSSMLPDKIYEWAGLYSDVYKTEDPPRLSSAVNTECLEYDPEEHEHGLFPPPMHVGKYLRLKRIDFQLPYDIYWHCVHDKFNKISDAPLKTVTSNGLSGVMSLTQPEDSPCKFHKDNVPHDCISDSFISQRLPAEKAGEEISQTALDNMLPNQSDPHKQPEGSSDAENIPSPLLMMPLSGEERSFVLKHGIFLMRNYEKMRERQALLLREGVREREKENKDDGGNSQSQNGVLGESTNTKSDQHLTQSSPRCENRLSGERGQERSVQNRDLTQTLQGIYDVIVSYKGSSGQTLAAPLLNLCSRKRSGTAPVDLSTLQKQLHSGQYESLELFHSDMLRVFHCAEKYYGCESSVGRNVRQLREVYHSAYQEALTQIGNFL